VLTSKVRAAVQLNLVSLRDAKARRLMPNTCGICGGHVQECIRTTERAGDHKRVTVYPGGCKGLINTPRETIKRLNELSWRISQEDAESSGRKRGYQRTNTSQAMHQLSR
jgi:hypothetical protein